MEDRAAFTGHCTIKVLPREQPKTQVQKYHTASQTCKEISSLLAEMGTVSFNQCHEVLKNLLALWAAGKKVTVTELSEFFFVCLSSVKYF